MNGYVTISRDFENKTPSDEVKNDTDIIGKV